MEDTSIPDGVFCETVMQIIEEYDLPPLTGKHRHQQSLSPSNQSKRAQIEYDYKCVQDSVLSDWLGEVPRFPDSMAGT
jgi:hypothetical protein